MMWTVGGTNAPKIRSNPPRFGLFLLPVNACFIQAKVGTVGTLYRRTCPPAGTVRRCFNAATTGHRLRQTGVTTRDNTLRGRDE